MSILIPGIRGIRIRGTEGPPPSKAMSRPSVEIAAAIFEAARRRDFDLARRWLSPDVTLVFHADSGPRGSTATGTESVVKWLQGWFGELAPDLDVHMEEARDFGDRVLIVAGQRGSSRVSDTPVTARSAHLFTIKDGIARRIEIWADPESALEALELPS